MSVNAYIDHYGKLSVQSNDATSTFALKSFLEQTGELTLKVLDTEFKLREPARALQAPTQYPTPSVEEIDAPTPLSGPGIRPSAPHVGPERYIDPESGESVDLGNREQVVEYIDYLHERQRIAEKEIDTQIGRKERLRNRRIELVKINRELRAELKARIEAANKVIDAHFPGVDKSEAPEIQAAKIRKCVAHLKQKGEELGRLLKAKETTIENLRELNDKLTYRMAAANHELAAHKAKPDPEVDYKYLVEITGLGIKVGDRELIDGDELKLGRGLALVYKEVRNGQEQPSHGFSAAPSAIQSGEGMIQYWLGEEKLTRSQALKRIANAGFNDSFKLGAYRELAASTILKLRQHSERLKVIQQTLRDDNTQRLHKVVREQTAGVRFNDE